MLTIPDREGNSSLKDFLMEKYGEIFTIHRLDRDTSGLVLFAKNAAAHQYYSGIFEKREVNKYYIGVVKGSPAEAEGKLDSPIMEHPRQKGMMIPHRDGKQALTTYSVLQSFPQYSMVLFQIHTGRTHQIRVHAREAGFPIVCDSLYGDGKPVFLSEIKSKYKRAKNEEAELPLLNRLGLHAFKLIFNNRQGTEITVEAPVPKSFEALMRQLQKWRGI